MIEEIFLPIDSVASRQEALPIPNDAGKRGNIAKTQQQMNMVWHENGQVTIPLSLFVVVGDRLKDSSTFQREAKMILFSGLSTNGDEVDRSLVEPQWNFVVQTMMRQPVHGASFQSQVKRRTSDGCRQSLPWGPSPGGRRLPIYTGARSDLITSARRCSSFGPMIASRL